MSGSVDYYEVLGVLPSAESIVIRAAYRALAQQYHPDKSPDDPMSGIRMREINNAYSVLSDEAKRQAYDEERKQHEEDAFGFENEAVREALEDLASLSDWLVAVEYYPDLIELHKHLKQTSPKLGFAYRSTLLEGKDFKKRAQIAQHFAQVDPKSAATYQANLKRFDDMIDSKMAEWQRTLAPYKGAKLVTYHKDFPYLAERFGFEIVENLEPKPGIAPSPAHLAKVITAMKSANAKVILVQPYQNRKTAETVTRQTGATVLDMPQQPGAVKGTDTYFQLMDHLVGQLASALKAS